MDCIFCKIIEEEIPSFTIYEDETVKALLDVNPDSNGHVLLMPKKHIVDIDDMDSDTLAHIWEIAKMLKKRLEERLSIDGLVFIQNNGAPQEVKHYHLHLKPYYKEKEALKDVKEIYEILK